MRKRLRKKLLKKRLGYCTFFGAGTWSSSKFALDYHYYLEAVKMRNCNPSIAMFKACTQIEREKFFDFYRGQLAVPFEIISGGEKT